MDIKKLKALQQQIYKKSKNNTIVAYPIVAIGINKNGDVVGFSSNKINNYQKGSRHGNGLHAERELIKKFGKSIKTIFLYRKGKDGICLPIHPCKVCKKICDKLNIKIYSMNQII